MTAEKSEEMEKKNVKLFSEYELSRSNEYMYNCVLCGESCCLDNSMSHRGHRLICNRCSITEFYTLHDAFEFVYEDREYGKGA